MRGACFFLNVFVCLSTVTFIIESSYEKNENVTDADDEQRNIKEENNYFLRIVQYVDQLAITFFTVEFLLRLLLCPRKKRFITDNMNLGKNFIDKRAFRTHFKISFKMQLILYH